MNFMSACWPPMAYRRGGQIILMSTDDERRTYFTGGLPRDYTVYGSYHWLILEHGKAHCRKTPLCDTCPLSDICAYPSR